MEKVLHSQMPFTTGGQTISDRLTAAKHSIAGSQLGKAVCKATTEEMSGPKKKHLDYLLHCTHEPNVSIPQMANFLVERTQNSNWCVVFKSLITLHNLMCYGNERFTQYLASSNVNLNLGNFLDKTSVMGYDMSTHIRRYAKYIGEKIFTYRLCAFDFCKVKRGKEDGLLRTMATEKLIKTLPTLQGQIDALLEFQVSTAELSNGVINSAFILLFRDLIRLFACYNDGIINLLEKYFDMNKKQCKDALDLYKKFLLRMDKVAEFLKVAESVGIDRGEIPDLAKAPNSLLEALEQHLTSLEGSKSTGSRVTSPVTTGAALAATQRVINSFSGLVDNNSVNLFEHEEIDEATKRKYLEEEQQRLALLKEQRLKEMDVGDGVRTTSNNPFLSNSAGFSSDMRRSNVDLLDSLMELPAGPTSQTTLSGDLFSLQPTNPFIDNSAVFGSGSSSTIQARELHTSGVSQGPKANFVSDDAFAQVFSDSKYSSDSAFGEMTGTDVFGMGSATIPNPPSRGPSPAFSTGLSTNPFVTDPSLAHSPFDSNAAAWMPLSTPQNSPAVKTAFGMDPNADEQDSSPELPNPADIGNPFASFQQNAASFGATSYDATVTHAAFGDDIMFSAKLNSVLDDAQFDLLAVTGTHIATSSNVVTTGPNTIESRVSSEAIPINVYQHTPFSGFDNSYTASPQLPHRATGQMELDSFASTPGKNAASGALANTGNQPSGGKLFGSDLDSSLLNLAQNLTIDKKQQNSQRGPVQWGPRPSQLTGTAGVAWGSPVPQPTYGVQPGWTPGLVGNPPVPPTFMPRPVGPYRPMMNPSAAQYIPSGQQQPASSLDPFGAI